MFIDGYAKGNFQLRQERNVSVAHKWAIRTNDSRIYKHFVPNGTNAFCFLPSVRLPSARKYLSEAEDRQEATERLPLLQTVAGHDHLITWQ